MSPASPRPLSWRSSHITLAVIVDTVTALLFGLSPCADAVEALAKTRARHLNMPADDRPNR